MTYAIIGGSGLARLTALTDGRREMVSTPYGDPSGPITLGRLGGTEVAFIARHGDGHAIAPHQINYRANIWALKQIGVRGVFGVATVGGVRGDYGPGTLVVPDQIIDYTHGRPATFHEGAGAPVVHVDFTWPYSAALRAVLLSAARDCGETVVDGGVYACTQGPRLETAAEVERIARDGGDLIGMTGMPEAALAREAGLDYAALAVVVNHAAGRGDSALAISLSEIEEVMRAAITRASRVLEVAVRLAA